MEMWFLDFYVIQIKHANRFDWNSLFIELKFWVFSNFIMSFLPNSFRDIDSQILHDLAEIMVMVQLK